MSTVMADATESHMCPERALVELIRLLNAEGFTVRIRARNAIRDALRNTADLLVILGVDPYPNESPGPVSEAPAGA